MISAGLSCPLDVCKTRIISRDRAAEASSKVVDDSVLMNIDDFNFVNNNQLNVNNNAVSKKKIENKVSIINDNKIVFLDNVNSEIIINKKANKYYSNLNSNLITNSKQKINISNNINNNNILNIINNNNNNNNNNNINNNNQNNNNNNNILIEMFKIYKNEGFSTLFLGLQQRLIYTGFANGIRLAAYGTSRMDLMMKSLDDI
jgi:hypothetical protein